MSTNNSIPSDYSISIFIPLLSAYLGSCITDSYIGPTTLMVMMCTYRVIVDVTCNYLKNGFVWPAAR